MPISANDRVDRNYLDRDGGGPAPNRSGYAQTIDPAIARLLHGGWPFVREIGVLLQRSNVYLDLSLQSLMMTPRTQSQWLREWLEWEPGKVLFAPK